MCLGFVEERLRLPLPHPEQLNLHVLPYYTTWVSACTVIWHFAVQKPCHPRVPSSNKASVHVPHLGCPHLSRCCAVVQKPCQSRVPAQTLVDGPRFVSSPSRTISKCLCSHMDPRANFLRFWCCLCHERKKPLGANLGERPHLGYSGILDRACRRRRRR